MKTSTFIFIAYLMLLASWAAANETKANYYVDPVSGNDQNDGRSATQAFKTIEKAQTSLRSINADMTEDRSVYLRGGVHSLSSTLEFSEKDSGTGGHDIIYGSSGNCVPRG